MAVAGVEVAEPGRGVDDRRGDVRFLDVHVVDVEVDLDVRGVDAPAHLDALGGGVEDVGLVAVHDLEAEVDVAPRRHLGHLAQDVAGAGDAVRRSAGCGTCRSPSRGCRRSTVPPQSRQTETASSKSALPRFSLSGSPEEMSASKSRPIEKAMPMPAASSSLVVTAGSIEDGIERRGLDEVVAGLGGPVDRARGLLPAPAVLPDEGVDAELVHAALLSGPPAGGVVDALEVGGVAVAHVLHLGDDPLHLGVVEDRRLAEGQRLDVEPRQGLDLDGVGEALRPGSCRGRSGRAGRAGRRCGLRAPRARRPMSAWVPKVA